MKKYFEPCLERGSDDIAVCSVDLCCCDCHQILNTRHSLISSSPELLEALEACVEVMTELSTL